MMETHDNTNTMKTTNTVTDPDADMDNFINETVTMDVTEFLDQIIDDMKTEKQSDNDNSKLVTNRNAVWRMMRMWSANKTKYYERDSLRNSFDVSNFSAISAAISYDHVIDRVTRLRNRQAKYSSQYTTTEIAQINARLSR